MRKVSSFVAAALIMAAIGGWIAATTTRASAVKVEDPYSRYPIGGALPALTIAF
jgi:hypothetical protein